MLNKMAAVFHSLFKVPVENHVTVR